MEDRPDPIDVALSLDPIIVGVLFPWPIFETTHPVECPEGFDPREN